MSLTVSIWWGGMKTRPGWLLTPFESWPFKFTTLLLRLLLWKCSALSTSLAVEPLVSALSALPLVCMSVDNRARFAGGGGEPSSPAWFWESRPTQVTPVGSLANRLWLAGSCSSHEDKYKHWQHFFTQLRGWWQWWDYSRSWGCYMTSITDVIHEVLGWSLGGVEG